MPKQSDTDDKGFYVGPRVNLLHAQSDGEPVAREGLEQQLFDLIELARDTRSDKGGEARWVHPIGALVIEFAKRIGASPRPDASAELIEAVLTFEPYLADEGFGKERSLKWMVEHFYRTHLPEEKAKNVTERYLAAIRAHAADRSGK